MAYMGQNQGRQGEIHHPTHRFWRSFLDLFLTECRVPVQKPFSNKFIHYHISSREVFGINHFKLRTFAAVAIEFFSTVDRGTIMARLHTCRWSTITYRSLQAEFMGAKYYSHIHRYGTPIFGKIAVQIYTSIYIYISINNTNQIFWRL